MNTLTEKYINADYDVIASFSENMTLVRSRANGKLLVRKLIDAGAAGIYRDAAKINAPGIPKIVSVEPQGALFVVIYEYVEGVTVREYVEKNGAMAEAEVNKHITDICRALAELHKIGIVHRDITPSNVVIASDGCYIIDLGIARRVSGNKNADTRILGTAGFAAPEQFGFRQTDARADIYSVGVLMHYMLTGRMPNEAEATERINAVSQKCMELDPKNRYSSAEELGAAVERKHAPEPMALLRGAAWLVLAALLAAVVLDCTRGGHDVRYILKLVFMYILLMFVPVAALFDLFRIIERLSYKNGLRLPWRIGIRLAIIAAALCLIPIIDEIIQRV